ncbi:MAG TPA: hypothetical protein VF587_14005 [Solirubrobacteraceae bacterium]|jgi:hypothetical protein
MRRALLLAALVCGALAPAAHAGTPFTIGEGQDPHLVVDPNGMAHVVWNDDQFVHYCQAPRGATACTNQRDLPLELEYGGDSSYLVAEGSLLHIVLPHYVNGDTYVWTSTDNGATWGSKTKLYDFGGGTDSTEPLLGPKSGELTMAAWNTSATVWGAALDGGESAETAHATLAGGEGFDAMIAPTEDGGLVAVTNDLTNASFFRMTPGTDPSDQASWSGPSVIGAGKDTRLAGGPGGVYLLSTVPEPSGGAHQEVRKWTGSGFGAPFVIGESGYINDIHVAPSGAVAAIYRRNDTPNRLRMAFSTNGGSSFGLFTIAIDDVVMDSMDVALASDNQGWATYEGGAGSSGSKVQIRLVDTQVVQEEAVSDNPPSIQRVTSDVGGAQLLLDLPGNCIPANGKFQAQLKVRRFPRRGTFVNVKKVDFLIGRKRVKRDKKAPFVQTITVPSPVAGKTYTLRTKAFIKRKGKRKLQRKALKAKITICAS